MRALRRAWLRYESGNCFDQDGDFVDRLRNSQMPRSHGFFLRLPKRSPPEFLKFKGFKIDRLRGLRLLSLNWEDVNEQDEENSN